MNQKKREARAGSGLKVKAGGLQAQHNRALPTGIKIRTRIRSGGFSVQHNRKPAAGIRVKAAIKAGGMQVQHNRKPAGPSR